MMSQVYIIDFDDSFTYNIAAYFYELNITVKVIPYTLIDYYINEFIDKRKKIIVWGPGPKNPYEYENIFPILKLLDHNPHIFHLGICLGHQMMLINEGFYIVPATEAVHGGTREIFVPDWNTLFDASLQNKAMMVQRYNSLAVQDMFNSNVKTYAIDQEVVIAGYRNGVSYQFHPESVGTSFPDAFFDSSLNFLYNSKDGRKTQNSRHL